MKNDYLDRFIGMDLGGGHYIYAESRGENKIKIKWRIPSGKSKSLYTIRKDYLKGKYIPFLWDLLREIQKQR